MAKKLSVIVPVYNTKNELEKCISSICNQTYKNLEIICVDDGSTDGSEKIVDYFGQIDTRVKVIHQENAGESSARNTGLKVATGDYITFCDCDDWLDLDMYDEMIKELELYDVDMICASWYKEVDGQSIPMGNELQVVDGVFGQSQLLKYLYMRDSYRGLGYMWNKIYKKEIVKEPDGSWMLFDETISLGGDIIYLAKLALNAKSAKYIDRCFYHYLQRDTSGCHTKNLDKLMERLKSYEIVIELFENYGVEKETLDYVKRFLVYHSSNAVVDAVNQNDDYMKQQFQQLMKRYEDEYIKLNQAHPERIDRYYELVNM